MYHIRSRKDVRLKLQPGRAVETPKSLGFVLWLTGSLTDWAAIGLRYNSRLAEILWVALVRPNRQDCIEVESELVPLEHRMMVTTLRFSHDLTACYTYYIIITSTIGAWSRTLRRYNDIAAAARRQISASRLQAVLALGTSRRWSVGAVGRCLTENLNPCLSVRSFLAMPYPPIILPRMGKICNKYASNYIYFDRMNPATQTTALRATGPKSVLKLSSPFKI